MPRTRWSGRGDPVAPSNATELLLRSGRLPPAVDAAPIRSRPSMRRGLDDLGHRLGVALIALSPHRTSADEPLRRAYRSIHDAMGDLAVVLALVNASEQQAPPARRARLRRPWGARS